ncbi:MAG: hypothetical protein ABI811_03105 [Acidobacteriota bacterium]
MRRPLVAFLVLSGVSMAQPVAALYGLTSGPARLESAGALAFGPEGILFVGDAAGGAIFALDTGDRAAVPETAGIAITSIDKKIAALLGTTPAQVQFNDIKVNPISKNVYLALSRGRGPDAIPVLLRIEPSGAMSELRTDNIPHARMTLPGLSAVSPLRRRTASRVLAITDLQYSEGQLVVAGLSNEDFSSTLRVIPFPFSSADRGASIEIFHTSHFAYETNAPVRTMVPYTSGGERFLLAAYTCTPLVKLRMSDWGAYHRRNAGGTRAA